MDTTQKETLADIKEAVHGIAGAIHGNGDRPWCINRTQSFQRFKPRLAACRTWRDAVALSRMVCPISLSGAQGSPHFQIGPKVSAKTGSSTSMAANRSTSGSNRCSGMVGMSS